MKERGFTLIEMMMVVAIIGILSAIAIPMFHSYRAKTYDVTAEANLRQLMSFEEAYFGVHFNYVPIDDTAPGPRTVYVNDTDNFKIGDRIHMRISLLTANNVSTYAGVAFHAEGKHSYLVTGSVGIIVKK